MRSVAALCLVALALAGCAAAPRDSAKQFKGGERAVAAVVERVESAARDDDPAIVCTRLLSTSLLAALSKQGTNCRTGVKEAFRDANPLDLTVDDVEIRGSRAIAKVNYRSGSKDKNATLDLDREAGAWKISSGIIQPAS
jgi:hypothetical protein